jgi:hypothetical protein
MALTEIIAGTTAAIGLDDADEIAISGPVTLVAGKMSAPSGGVEESIVTYIKTLTGDYETVQPPIVLSYLKNTDMICATGTFKFVKTATKELSNLGYE